MDAALLEEAADWLVRLRSGEATDNDRAKFEHWRRRSPRHEAAWERAEAVLGAFDKISSDIGRGTLGRLGKRGRRRALQALGLLLGAAPVGWLALRHAPQWSADLRTATGEQKALDLVDGTRLVLNTASAVDVAFSATERRLRLVAGEILVTTGTDPAPVYRPFLVETPQVVVQALGTRFSVRRLDARTQVAVFADAVKVRPAHAPSLRLQAGEQAEFTAAGASAIRATDATAALWEQGMLVAKNMRLADLAAELARYRHGVIRVHPGVADMHVSGAFPLKDTGASLRLLQKTLPLRVGGMGRYWVSLEGL